MFNLQDKKIVLGLTGGIACYKSAQLCRLLIKVGAEVTVVMTESATEFITPLTMQSLSKNTVYLTSTQDSSQYPMPHIDLTRQADAIIIAPATADFIAQLAHGTATDLLSLLCLARPIQQVPLLLAPSMNRQMWGHPATQRNIDIVMADGAKLLGISDGEQACGEFGLGRMCEPDQLIQLVESALSEKKLLGKKVLLTAGPTFEAIDAVRGITNLSSGKMGFCLARAASELGAQVVLVTGPVAQHTPQGVQRIDVQSAQQMAEQVAVYQEWADVFIAVAAVSDWTPINAVKHKIKKQDSQNNFSIDLVKTTDILQQVSNSAKALAGELFCVGFAAESEDLQTNAQLKRQKKNVPLLIANQLIDAVGKDENQVLMIEDNKITELPKMNKLTLARRLMQEISQRILFNKNTDKNENLG